VLLVVDDEVEANLEGPLPVLPLHLQLEFAEVRGVDVDLFVVVHTYCFLLWGTLVDWEWVKENAEVLFFSVLLSLTLLRFLGFLLVGLYI